MPIRAPSRSSKIDLIDMNGDGLPDSVSMDTTTGE